MREEEEENKVLLILREKKLVLPNRVQIQSKNKQNIFFELKVIVVQYRKRLDEGKEKNRQRLRIALLNYEK